MLRKRTYTKERGQSLPIIAGIILVLVGLVGLAVDLGNTYAEQRNVTRATDASALAGMKAISQNQSDANIRKAIVQTLRANGMTVMAPGEPINGSGRLLTAFYIGADGNPLASCQVGSCGVVPSGVAYLQIKVEGFQDTFFARIFGQNTMPVQAQAFGCRISPVSGVYPIGVRMSDLNDNGSGFYASPIQSEQQYYGYYSDEIYRNRTFRRMYLRDSIVSPSSAVYLRWNSTYTRGNATDAEKMLTGDGTLGEGFSEIAWPMPNSMGKAAPDGYPIKPEQLTPDDWVRGNVGVTNGGQFTNEFQKFIDNRTVLALPIVAGEAGSNDSKAYYVQSLGAFVALKYGFQSDVNSWYIDMMYVGDAATTAGVCTNAVETDKLNLTGSVYLRPRDEATARVRQPIEYVVVLDVSGSMSWNFAGEAQDPGNGSVWQCEATGNADSDRNLINCGTWAWLKKSERRIAISKVALQNFVDLMEPTDVMSVISFTGGSDPTSSVKVLENGADRQRWFYGTDEEKVELKNAILANINYLNDPYLTAGGTPTSTGLRRARELLSDNSTPDTAPDGKTYRKVVVLMTDGMANYFLQESNVPWGGTSWYNSAQDICPNMPLNQPSSNTPYCQTGALSNGVPRPITAMVQESVVLKDDLDATIFVLAMGNMAPAGMQDTASAPDFPFFTYAKEGGAVDTILRTINQTVEGGCIPGGGTQWINVIEPEHMPIFQAPNELPEGVYGYVYLYDQFGNKLPEGKYKVPVVADPVTGRITYAVGGLAPGTYRMEAQVGYRGADEVSRMYGTFFNKFDFSTSSSYVFSLSPKGTLNTTVALDPIYLDLSGKICN